jgi:hypothetical protein
MDGDDWNEHLNCANSRGWRVLIPCCDGDDNGCDLLVSGLREYGQVLTATALRVRLPVINSRANIKGGA